MLLKYILRVERDDLDHQGLRVRRETKAVMDLMVFPEGQGKREILEKRDLMGHVGLMDHQDILG